MCTDCRVHGLVYSTRTWLGISVYGRKVVLRGGILLLIKQQERGIFWVASLAWRSVFVEIILAHLITL